MMCHDLLDGCPTGYPIPNWTTPTGKEAFLIDGSIEKHDDI